MYAALAIIAAIFPLILIFNINFDAEGAQKLADAYPGRAASFTTLLNVIAIAVWLWLFSAFILGPLKAHRTGDRPLLTDLAELRRGDARARPRLYFYIVAVIAFALMAALFLAKT
jgi:hypothetical protein